MLLLEQFHAIGQFLNAGGSVLWAIMLVAMILWTLIIESYWYQWRIFPRELTAVARRWRPATADPWLIARIRQKEISRLRHRLGRSLFLIRTMIILCPLLGLLGTVTGMIQVFEVLAFSGTGDPRAMAAGVSRATIPTMSGLVVAISGFYFSVNLQRSAEAGARRAAEVLRKQQT